MVTSTAPLRESSSAASTPRARASCSCRYDSISDWRFALTRRSWTKVSGSIDLMEEDVTDRIAMVRVPSRMRNTKAIKALMTGE
jgi:hypothetical protein